jgi:hypothetical protein
MKTFAFPKKFRNIFIVISFIILLIAGGCYTIKYIIQPDVVAPNSSFSVKIVIKADENTDPSDFWPAYGYLGILLPDGWKVKDSIYYTKSGEYLNQNRLFTYNELVVSFLKSKAGLPPSGYHWWGAKSKDLIQLNYSDTGFVNITITTDARIGDYKIKYVFGDDTDWNKQLIGDLFGVVTESKFIPIKVDITQHSEKNRNNEELSVFPNPATDQVTFSWNENSGMLNLKMFQPNGTCVIDKEISSNETVDVSDLSKGIYFYRLSNKNEIVKTGKLVVE